MTTCGFCYKDYSGKLEDHLKREHFQDIGDAASYVAYLEERINALENRDR
jgi:hypothetical protein